MAGHAEDALGSACIAQVLDLPLAIPAPEAVGAKGLVAGQDGEVFDLVAAVIAAVGAVVADQGAVSEQQQVGVRVEQGAAGVAAEAVDVPSVAGCGYVSGGCRAEWKARARRRVPVAGCSAYLVRMPCLPRESCYPCRQARFTGRIRLRPHTCRQHTPTPGSERRGSQRFGQV